MAGHETLPLYVEDFAPYDHERSVTSPLYVEVFATTLGSLFRIALRTTYRAPLRGGLCHRSDSYEQTHVQERGYPRQNCAGNVAIRIVPGDTAHEIMVPSPRGHSSPHPPPTGTTKTKLSSQDELFTWYGGVI